MHGLRHVEIERKDSMIVTGTSKANDIDRIFFPECFILLKTLSAMN
jgi:hypothetical protein